MIFKVIKNGTIQDERGLDMVLTAGQRLHEDGIDMATLIKAQVEGILAPDDGTESVDVAFTPVMLDTTQAKTKPQTDSTNTITD